MDLASELQQNSSGITEHLGPICNENDVHNVAFKLRIIPSDSIEDYVQNMGRCPRI